MGTAIGRGADKAATRSPVLNSNMFSPTWWTRHVTSPPLILGRLVGGEFGAFPLVSSISVMPMKGIATGGNGGSWCVNSRLMDRCGTILWDYTR